MGVNVGAGRGICNPYDEASHGQGGNPATFPGNEAGGSELSGSCHLSWQIPSLSPFLLAHYCRTFLSNFSRFLASHKCCLVLLPSSFPCQVPTTTQYSYFKALGLCDKT